MAEDVAGDRLNAEDMQIRPLIETSFALAQKKPVRQGNKQVLHQDRGRAWVEALALGFKEHYRNDSNVLVFSKHDASHRKDFRLNELLHDILACRTDHVLSAVHKKTLYYVRDVLWQVESELERDSRQALIDFSKLVLGSAKNKLFIGPKGGKAAFPLEVLRAAAAACQGNVFVALTPHPSRWDEVDNSVEVWKFDEGDWVSF